MTTYRYKGSEYDDAYEAIMDAYSEGNFIDDYSSEIEICGYRFYDLEVLEKVDNIAFREAYDEMIDVLARELAESGDGNRFDIEVIEDDEDEDEEDDE